MNKGLLALGRITGTQNLTMYEQNECLKTIEEELKEKETQDSYIKMLEDRINNLETTYLRNKKALDIIKNKKVDVKYLYYRAEFNVEKYNDNYLETLTKEECHLLKEALL
jgi:predicted RNase H-like nuclease (RuvC/YqgF family)